MKWLILFSMLILTIKEAPGEVTTATPESTTSIDGQINPIKENITKIIEQLKQFPTLTKNEIEQLENYMKKLNSLSKAWSSASQPLKDQIIDRFNELKQQIEGLLKVIQQRLPTSTTPPTTTTLKPTTAPTTPNKTVPTGTVSSTKTAPTTSRPITSIELKINQLRKIIKQTIKRLGQYPSFVKKELDQLKTFDKTLDTLLKAYNSGSKKMKDMATKKFETLEKIINDYLKTLQDIMPPTPTSTIPTISSVPSSTHSSVKTSTGSNSSPNISTTNLSTTSSTNLSTTNSTTSSLQALRHK